MTLHTIPTNSFQFERDFKAYKDEPLKLQQYMLNIKSVNIAQIFKSDLEADLMLGIFKFFNSQPSEWLEGNKEYLVEFVAAIQAVKPFELTCEFLIDDEISVIKTLFKNLSAANASQDELSAIKSKFSKVNIIV